MESTNRKAVISVIFLLVFSLLNTAAMAVQPIAEKQRLFDEAELLDAGDKAIVEAELEKKSQELDADFIIVTKKQLDGQSIQSLANTFFEKHGNKNGSGAILAISMLERDINFTAFGKTFEQHKRRLDRIRSSIGKHMTAQRYKQAFLHFTEQVDPPGFFGRIMIIAGYWQPWVFSLVLTAIVVGFLAYNHRGSITVGSSTYAVPGAFDLISSEDRYLRTTTTKTRISSSKSSGGGGGRSSGGSSGKF